MDRLRKVLSDRGLLSGSVGSLTVKVIGLVLALAVSVLLASLMGPKSFGVYVVAFSTVNLLSIPLTLGIPIMMVRYIPKYELESDFSAINGLIIRAHQMLLVLYFIPVAIVLTFFLIVKNETFEAYGACILWSLGLLLFVGLNAVRCAVLEGFRYVALGQIPDLVLRNLMILVFVSVCSRFQEINPEEALFLHFLSSMIAYICGVILAKRVLRKHLKGFRPKYDGKVWFKKSLTFSFNAGINNIKTKISIYTLAYIQGAEAVGIFEVAIRLASFVSFSLTAINKALAPHISKAFQSGEKEKIQEMMQNSSKAMFAMAVPVIMTYFIFGEDIISVLFGDQYILAFIPLVIISIGQMVNSYAGSVGLFLIMANKHNFVLKVNVINVLVNVVMALMLTSWLGVYGAAIAFSLLLFLQNFIFVIYIKKNFGIKSTAL